jgi:protein-S-isoprenylcysteine O-methyltransferase Ste14
MVVTGRRARSPGPRRNRRPDLGKLVMVPTAVLFLVVDAATIGRGSGPRVLNWLSTALVCVFYALIIWCYLRRRPATATSRSVTAHAAAVTATLTPFVFPLLRAGAPGIARQWAGNLLIAAGTAWAVWSLRSLGRNVAVLAQARELTDTGPYRWIRHPLYTGEIVSSLGLVLLAGSLAALAVWLAFIALQAYRALREEQLLVQELPGYRAYQARTAALLPGLFLTPACEPTCWPPPAASTVPARHGCAMYGRAPRGRGWPPGPPRSLSR